ncbi:probable replication factor C subunit 4 isoform X2 [Schistocerca gregaria]|nr:probable replication factor C subunit 4 isoform X2 [Schistocerca gregaria]
MTPDAQNALRRIMEIHSKVTRFCLICNYVTRIIEPLVSRTARFRFRPLRQEAVETRLRDIARREGFDCKLQTIQKIAEISQGDMRRAITFLQSVKIMGVHGHPEDVHEAPSADSSLDADYFLSDFAGMIQPSVLNDFVNACKTLPNMSQLQKRTHQLVIQGYSMSQLASQLTEKLVLDPNLKESSKAHIFKELGKIDMALIEGADDELQCQRLAFTLKKYL